MAAPAAVPAPGPVLVLTDHLRPADIPMLCAHLACLLQHQPHTVVCDAAAVQVPSAVTVNALARLQLTAKRRGCRIWLRNPGADLLALLELVGLAELFAIGPD